MLIKYLFYSYYNIMTKLYYKTKKTKKVGGLRGFPLRKTRKVRGGLRGFPLRKTKKVGGLRGFPLRKIKKVGGLRGFPLRKTRKVGGLRGFPLRKTRKLGSLRGFPLRKTRKTYSAGGLFYTSYPTSDPNSKSERILAEKMIDLNEATETAETAVKKALRLFIRLKKHYPTHSPSSKSTVVSYSDLPFMLEEEFKEKAVETKAEDAEIRSARDAINNAMWLVREARRIKNTVTAMEAEIAEAKEKSKTKKPINTLTRYKGFKT